MANTVIRARLTLQPTFSCVCVSETVVLSLGCTLVSAGSPQTVIAEALGAGSSAWLGFSASQVTLYVPGAQCFQRTVKRFFKDLLLFLNPNNCTFLLFSMLPEVSLEK